MVVVEEGSYLQEEVEREQIGSAVTLGDVAGLAAAIREMALNRNICNEMGLRAQALYTAQYAKEIGLQKYLAALNTTQQE